MAPVSKRRRPAVEEEEDEAEVQSEEEVAPNTQRRRRRVEESSDEDVEMEVDGDDEGDDLNQIVKKLVRYAMACEYSRIAIRREDIRTKVFGKQKAPFKQVFDGAQKELRRVFGMEMTELPMKEKVTLRERIAAGKKATVSTSSQSYTLTSTLPQKYRDIAILPPSKIPNSAIEASYTGLYTMIYSLITLSGGKLPDAKLNRYLQRMNADVNMPMDKSEVILQRMIRQGYIIRVKENTGGDENIEWIVGPRGKVEVGQKGVEGLVMQAYGDAAPEDLADRVKCSLGLETAKKEQAAPVADAAMNGEGSSRGRGRPRRTAADED